MHLVEDREFVALMSAGRPTLQLPKANTVSRDVRAAFTRCQQRIKNLLSVRLHVSLCVLYMLISSQEYPGRVSFATDAWTSPNHRGFLAWTIHLEHEGRMLAFVLDIIEVPEVSSTALLRVSLY